MENWNKVPLGEVLDYEQPTKYIVETTDYNNSYETPVLTAGKSFVLGYTKEKKGIFTDVPAIIFDDFTTAFHYVNFPFKVKSSAMKILKADKEKADLRFLYYRMSKISLDTDLHKRYWISKFSKAQIQLPPLETQKRIAQILDDAAALRLKTEQILKEYDLLAQSLFFDMFGDPVKNEKGWNTEIGENICKNISVGIVIKPASYYVTDGVIALRSLNIKKNNIDLSNIVHLSEEAHLSVLKKSILKTGDIVVVRTGNTGTAAIIPESLDGVNCIDLIIIRPDINKMNSKFFIYFLNSERGKLLILGKSVGGIQKHFNVGSMKKLILPVPPIELQNQFAEKIALIERQKELAKQELKESEDLFNCLLQKAFKGELA